MNRSIILIIFLLLVPAAQAETKNYAIFYLDKTESMNGKIADGTSRCDATKKIAKVSVRNFFEKWNGRAIDVRTFSDPGKAISLTNGFTDSKSMALTAIDDSPCDGPSTALADAICEGADLLRQEFSALAADSETFLMLVAATDGDENSSTGPCGGLEWKEKVEEKIKAISPRVRLNLSVFGELQKIATGTASGSSIASSSLLYFSRLSNESGGSTIFINDYARELPSFVPIFPNDEKVIAEMKAANIPTEAWSLPAEADSIGYGGLKLDADSLKKTQQDILAIMQQPTSSESIARSDSSWDRTKILDTKKDQINPLPAD